MASLATCARRRNTVVAFSGNPAWSYADAAHAFLPPPRDFDSAAPQVVASCADLSSPAFPAGGWLLVAVVHTEDDRLDTAATDVAPCSCAPTITWRRARSGGRDSLDPAEREEPVVVVLASRLHGPAAAGRVARKDGGQRACQPGVVAVELEHPPQPTRAEVNDAESEDVMQRRRPLG